VNPQEPEVHPAWRAADAAPAVGIDLGGTKVHAGVVTPGGKLLGDARLATQADREAEAVLANIVEAATRALEMAGLDARETCGIGLGSPAPLDLEAGVILSPGNLPALHGFPIVARLREALGARVVLNNDANCFGLAEARFGAGAGSRVCCGLTLGTGLGGFLVIEGEVYNGPHGAGMEVWCAPYMGEDVEERVSGRGVSRNYHDLTGEQMEAQQIAERARSGDKNASQAWRRFGRDLAAPVAYLCNVADPDVCVMGGSMSKAWDLFHDVMMAEATKHINPVTLEAVRIVPGSLGQEAGVLGAAALALEGRLPRKP